MTTSAPSFLEVFKNLGTQEIKEIFFWDGFDSSVIERYPDDYEEIALFMKANGINKITTVKQHGGEDMGSDYYKVYQFDFEFGGAVYIKVDGSYSSYEGSDYDDSYLVKPVTKTIIDYEYL